MPHAQKDYATDVTAPEAGPAALEPGDVGYVSTAMDPEDGAPARTP